MRQIKFHDFATQMVSTPAFAFGEDEAEIAIGRRGRRTQLDDAQLQNRRSQFVQAFEGAWGDIGWKLPRCKKQDDLIDIFRPLDRTYVQNLIAPFRLASSESASDSKLRNIRFQLRALIPLRYKSDELNRRALEQLQDANRALSQASGSARRGVKSWRKKCRKDAWRICREYRNLRDSEAHLQQRLSNLEASFARQQLLHFLKSKRYEVAPLSLANALAGIPYMGWRQSMRRTSAVECISANGLVFQVFKAVRYLVQTAQSRAESALIDHFRRGILSLPNRHAAAKKELAENWFYIQRAIRQACKARCLSKALPFEIMQRYQRQLQSRSSVDIALGQHYRLTAGARINRPRSQGISA